MGYVCTIAGGKGGVGKTTTAINLATVAAESHDVALLDADLGMANVGAMLGIEPDGTLHEVLAGEASLEDVIVTDGEGPAVVAGDRQLDAYAEADPGQLREVVGHLRAEYDLVVIDTGAGLSHDGLVPLGLGDGILLVTTPDQVAVRDTEKTADLAERVDGSVVGVVLNRVRPNTDVDEVTASLPHPVVGLVPDDSSAARRLPVVRRSPTAPAAAAYRRLADGIERVAFGGASVSDIAGNWEAPEDEPAPTTAEDGRPADSVDSDPASADECEGETDSSAESESDDAEGEDSDSGGLFSFLR